MCPFYQLLRDPVTHCYLGRPHTFPPEPKHKLPPLLSVTEMDRHASNAACSNFPHSEFSLPIAGLPLEPVLSQPPLKPTESPGPSPVTSQTGKGRAPGFVVEPLASTAKERRSGI